MNGKAGLRSTVSFRTKFTLSTSFLNIEVNQKKVGESRMSEHYMMNTQPELFNLHIINYSFIFYGLETG